jgi:hypothetical protein
LGKGTPIIIAWLFPLIRLDKKVSFFYTVGMKKLIWCIPLFGILSFHFLAGGIVSAEGINNIFNALIQFGPQLALNTLLAGIAIIIILLCGMRIYGFISFWLKTAVNLNLSAGLLIYFITGALFTFVVMMTAGVLGGYTPIIIWDVALLVIFFPYRLKAFFNNLKEFVQSIKISFNLDGHLLGSALVFFGIPLLVLQLTSMVPPWMDILEVYVAPVQRILSFGQYIPHDALPFALYNSSRSVPLFTAFYSFIAVLTGLQAAQAIVASSIYILFFALLAVFFTANLLGESPCGGIAVWLFSLSINFLSIPHGRSGVLVMLFFIPAIGFLFRMLQSEAGGDKLIFAILTGLALGATTLAHPTIGVYCYLLFGLVAVLMMIWISPRFFSWFLYILIIAGFISASLLFQVRESVHFSAPLTLLIWIGLGGLSGLGFHATRLWIKKHPESRDLPKLSRRSIIPIVIVVLAIGISSVFSWRFHWMNETPLNFLFTRVPFFIIFGFITVIRLIYLYFKSKTTPLVNLKLGTALLFIAGSFLLLALPLYILPLFQIEGSVGASLCQELPTKGMNYWLIPMLVVFAPMLIYGLKKTLWRDFSVLILLLLMVVPVFSLLSKFNFYDDARICLPIVAKGQLEVAAAGYFQGYGDPRKLLSDDDYNLVIYLRGLINTGQLKINDTVYHIAEEQHPWTATPFPAFTGVRQSLILVHRDPEDINTKWGRITDFPQDFNFETDIWVVAEKCVIEKYPDFFNQFREKYQTLFENNRLILFRQQAL